jgi:hypothetical protein
LVQLVGEAGILALALLLETVDPVVQVAQFGLRGPILCLAFAHDANSYR